MNQKTAGAERRRKEARADPDSVGRERGQKIEVEIRRPEGGGQQLGKVSRAVESLAD